MQKQKIYLKYFMADANKNIILTGKDIRRLKKVFDKDFEKIKNELAYEKLQREIENSYSM